MSSTASQRRPTKVALKVVLALSIAACGDRTSQPPRIDTPPEIAALDADGLSRVVRGRVLLGELGCTACHDDGGAAAAAASVDAVAGPDLRTAGRRLRAPYLHSYLASPLEREPGTAMPDLLRRWSGDGLRERADALASYVQSFSPPRVGSAAPSAPDSDAAARGAALYRRIGCRTCHGEGEPPDYLRSKYQPDSLQAFLLAPHEARPSGRMPDFALTPREANDLAHFLCSTPASSADEASATVAIDSAPALEPTAVARGRVLFGELRCARCHELPDAERRDAPPPPSLAALDPARGCLSGEVGAWPFYALSEPQRADIRQALAERSAPTPEERVQQALASRRCFACHRRGAVDRVSSRLVGDLFGTDDASLGLEGQVPPTLDGVGARLQSAWLAHAIARGQRERPYLHVRMPGFGEAFASRLSSLLEATDVLPPIDIAPLPEDHELAKPVLALGRDLVGDKGMSCITCHRFAGEQAGSMGAIDLVHTTGQRLRPEWFAHFLRDPFRFKPNTLMPHFFAGGQSTRPQFGDGDVKRQIDAMWHYLAAGRNVQKPSGLRQPPIELQVGEEAVLLRRAVQGTGKRGIAVGYPGGVNVTFDAEHLGLNQIWWGRFVDARPVWTSQGSGQAQILSSEIFALPNGPAFATLDTADAPWPTATRRERGDRWLGYDLDGQRRPTFRYTFGEVTVADALREVREGEGEVRLRRTLAFTVEGGGTGADRSGTRICFRVAVHASMLRIDDATVCVGDTMAIRFVDSPWSIVRVGGQEQKELRLPVELDGGRRVVELEYSRMEKGK